MSLHYPCCNIENPPFPFLPDLSEHRTTSRKALLSSSTLPQKKKLTDNLEQAFGVLGGAPPEVHPTAIVTGVCTAHPR